MSHFNPTDAGKEKLSLKDAAGKGLIGKLLKYLKPHRNMVGILLLLTVLLTATELSLPYILRLTIDTCLVKTGEASLPFGFRSTGDPIRDLLVFSIIFIFLVIIRYLLNFSDIILMTKLSQNILLTIRNDAFKKIESLSVTFFDKTPVGKLVTRVTNDVNALDNLFTEVMIYFFKDLFLLVGILLILVKLSLTLSLIVFSIIPFIVLATILFRIKIRKAYRRVRSELSKLNAFVQEHLNGMEVIQLFTGEKAAFKKFKKRSDGYFESTMQQMRIMAVFNPFISFASSFTVALIIWYGGNQYLNKNITIGIIVAFLEYVRMFFRPLADLTDKYNILQSALAAAERIFHIMDSDEYIKTVDPVRLPKKGKCSVEFKNVDFSYIEGIPVLRKISFRIEPGESLAIVGPTGAGKSSIINLICRFYDVNDGAVLIDGTDVRRVEPPELRKRIGLVLQDVFLFSGDIRKNIVLNNKEISDEVVYDVIERVNARGFIDNLPKRLDSVLGEGGLTLSAGQRQLLAFSRALVHDPDLLVLDEATASIDTETEEKIQAAIDHLVKGRTSIIIAHRLSTVQKADKIMVIDEGRIVEMGTHEQLLKKKGIYYGLYSLA